jgi:hypothetical protein
LKTNFCGAGLTAGLRGSGQVQQKVYSWFFSSVLSVFLEESFSVEEVSAHKPYSTNQKVCSTLFNDERTDWLLSPTKCFSNLTTRGMNHSCPNVQLKVHTSEMSMREPFEFFKSKKQKVYINFGRLSHSLNIKSNCLPFPLCFGGGPVYWGAYGNTWIVQKKQKKPWHVSQGLVVLDFLDVINGKRI